MKNRLGEGQALHNLGIAFRKQGRWADAEKVYHQALNIWKEISDVMQEGQTWDALANIYSDSGATEKAADAQKKSSEIADRLGGHAKDGIIVV